MFFMIFGLLYWLLATGFQWRRSTDVAVFLVVGPIMTCFWYSACFEERGSVGHVGSGRSRPRRSRPRPSPSSAVTV
jgi:hypothetical protein